MFKLIGLLKKRGDVDFEYFKDYYENKHAPYASEVLPVGRDYRRNYVKRLRVNGVEVDDAFEYDVVTEMWFDDEAGYEKFAAAMANDEIRRNIISDEEKFLDRSKSVIMIVEECGSK
ncbi:EthD domain-containing protein [Sphingobium sp. JS3065]|uniref:EthD domain-containing protein n=1 Tax=Sphingobium sp. JS3065 TaxID=2970925 RepID=UPI002263D20E|nr:EthD domain-containing protein [Sphingobium sp. JS3065]UZW57513.1 EthD domain-containing protein [Sphingobium sp. JS3065]